MKTILAIRNSSEKGKSSSILELAKVMLAKLPKNYTPIFSSKDINNLSIDFRLVLEINGKIVALESQGDPRTELEKRLNDIVKKYNPDLIICSTRTKGETIWAVNNVAEKYSYDKIWTSTYETSNNHQLINQLKGEHLFDLILKTII
jgi:hypothetical protein